MRAPFSLILPQLPQFVCDGIQFYSARWQTARNILGFVLFVCYSSFLCAVCCPLCSLTHSQWHTIHNSTAYTSDSAKRNSSSENPWPNCCVNTQIGTRFIRHISPHISPCAIEHTNATPSSLFDNLPVHASSLECSLYSCILDLTFFQVSYSLFSSSFLVLIFSCAEARNRRRIA